MAEGQSNNGDIPPEGPKSPGDSSDPETESDLERAERIRLKQQKEDERNKQKSDEQNKQDKGHKSRERDKRRRRREKERQKEYFEKYNKEYETAGEMLYDSDYSAQDSDYDNYKKAMMLEQQTLDQMHIRIEELQRTIQDKEVNIANILLIQNIIRQKCAEFEKQLLQRRTIAPVLTESQRTVFRHPTQQMRNNANTVFQRQPTMVPKRQNVANLRNSSTRRPSVWRLLSQ